jgi:ATP-dependent Clp protease ATP-binding subunit ClpC
MQLANREADRFKQEYIGTEHLLLGLADEASGIAANVLECLGLEHREIRRAVEAIGPVLVGVTWTGSRPHTPKVARAVKYANEEAAKAGHDCVGTGYLLLGLLREHQSVAAQLLMNAGLDLDDVRAGVLDTFW